MNENFEPKIHPAMAEIKLSPNNSYHLLFGAIIKLGILIYILSSIFKITSYIYSLN